MIIFCNYSIYKMAKQLGNKSIKKEEKCPCLSCLTAVNSATEILNVQFD